MEDIDIVYEALFRASLILIGFVWGYVIGIWRWQRKSGAM